MITTSLSLADIPGTMRLWRQRKAEFLLSNTVDDADYRKARREVRKLGLDPDSIQHLRPE